MLTLTLNLENEHLLNVEISEMIKSLSEEDKKEIAKNVLTNYLINTIDYQKKFYIDKKLIEIRENGWRGAASYYNKSAYELKDKTDEEIMKMDFWNYSVMKDYKSPKESLFEEINSLLKSELKSELHNFIKNNNELQTMIAEKQNQITENFKPIVSEMLTNIGVGFLFQALKNAELSQFNYHKIMNIENIVLNNGQ